MDAVQKKYREQIEDLVDASCRLGELGYVTSHGGNLSYKVESNVVLITPTKVVKRGMTFDDIVVVKSDGSVLFASPSRKPTGETPMHLRLYEKRPDINALVHAHPPVLTGFSMTDCDVLNRPLLPEPTIEVGPVISVDYAEPISEALAEKFDAVVEKTNAWLMKNHGVTICSSEGIARALALLEMTESLAKSAMTALVVGKINEIPREEVEKLENTINTRNLPRPGDPRVVKTLTDLYY